jgi:hypothetical protein
MKVAVLALITSILLQGPTSSAKDLLNLQRPLTAAEMDTVVRGIRQTLAGKTLRLVDGRYGSREILVGPDGLPRMVRSIGARPGERVSGVVTSDGVAVRIPEDPERFVMLIEYTVVPARRCDGATATGDTVVEYLMSLTTQVWTATARERVPGDMALARPLEMLRATASLKSGEARLIGTRAARAVVSPWPLFNAEARRITGDPAPDPAEFVPMQTMWVDTDSLLPLRWEVSERQAIIRDADFVHAPLELQRPAGIQAPTCIS